MECEGVLHARREQRDLGAYSCASFDLSAFRKFGPANVAEGLPENNRVPRRRDLVGSAKDPNPSRREGSKPPLAKTGPGLTVQSSLWDEEGRNGGLPRSRLCGTGLFSDVPSGQRRPTRDKSI